MVRLWQKGFDMQPFTSLPVKLVEELTNIECDEQTDCSVGEAEYKIVNTL